MKFSPYCAALLASAGTAVAQPVFTPSFTTVTGNTSDIGAAFSVSVLGNVSAGGNVSGGSFNISVLSGNALFSDLTPAAPWLAGAPLSPSDRALFLPSGFATGTFDLMALGFTRTAPGDIIIQVGPGALGISGTGSVNFESAQFTVVPTPGSAGLLACGLAVAMRRRR